MATSLNLPDDDTWRRKTGQAIVGSGTSHPLAIFRQSRPSSRADAEAGEVKKQAIETLDNRQANSFIPADALNSGDRVNKCNNLECSLTLLKLRHELRLARLQVKKLLKSQSEEKSNSQYKSHLLTASPYQSSRIHDSKSQAVKVKSSKVHPNSCDPANGFTMSHPLSLVPSSSSPNAIETFSPSDLTNAASIVCTTRRRKQGDLTTTGQQRRQLTHQSTVYSPSPAASDSSGYNVNSTAHSVHIHTSLPNSQSPSPTRHYSRSSSHQQLYSATSTSGGFNLMQPSHPPPSTLRDVICPYDQMARTQSGLELATYCTDEQHLACCTTASPGGRHTISVTCCDKANCTKPSIIHHHRRRPRSTGHTGSEFTSRSVKRQSDPAHVSITPPAIQSGRSSPVTSSHSIRPHSVATSQVFYSYRDAAAPIESVHSNFNLRTRVGRLGQGSLSQIHQTSDQSAQITPDEREQIALDPLQLSQQRHHRQTQVASEAPSSHSGSGSESRYKCYLYHC